MPFDISSLPHRFFFGEPRELRQGGKTSSHRIVSRKNRRHLKNVQISIRGEHKRLIVLRGGSVCASYATATANETSEGSLSCRYEASSGLHHEREIRTCRLRRILPACVFLQSIHIARRLWKPPSRLLSHSIAHCHLLRSNHPGGVPSASLFGSPWDFPLPYKPQSRFSNLDCGL